MSAGAWACVRAAVAVVIAVALTVQLVASAGAAVDRGWDLATTVANFFSLFSVQANILAMLSLGAAAGWTWWARRRGADEPPLIAAALAAVTTYMIWTGIVYNVVLRSPPVPEGTRVLWSNEVVHVVVPLFLIADLLLAPRLRTVPWTALVALPVFPIWWGFYTLFRGPVTVDPRTGAPFWYPYTFFNPNVVPGGLVGGYVGVGVRFVTIALVLTAIGAVVIWLSRRRVTTGRSPAPVGPPAGRISG
ncbi:Pr6Pr family membrane protein [Microbacterium sp. zg.B48]|uniref:Pr6Pr family membrane protein n=1 Tax=Microbacterium sp. zg.B48 TaxID=2969408 RepID=UPI00214C0270|nr:Pr6Pr family membrane protein [Microbacterium sp. zg.B48]MCR2762707.1 Pr6Pr family membrane protein [Microbacterium sp. zg.B48]